MQSFLSVEADVSQRIVVVGQFIVQLLVGVGLLGGAIAGASSSVSLFLGNDVILAIAKRELTQ